MNDHDENQVPYGGDQDTELLQRMRRVETRVSNLLRSIGLVPGSNPPDALKGRVLYDAGSVYVTAGDVSLAEVMIAATRGHTGKSGAVKIILHNQQVGAVYVHCK